MPHSDMGSYMNYNGPKVVALCAAGSAPQCGDAYECSWLFAGNTEYPAVLTRYVSDNPSGAVNQQERPAATRWEVGDSAHWSKLLLESSEAIRQPPRSDTEVKIWS
jgi:hypothetical protein